MVRIKAFHWDVSIAYQMQWQIPLKIIEVQSGPYLEEDDIEEFEDDHGKRLTTSKFYFIMFL